eukprot:gene5715-11538_t
MALTATANKAVIEDSIRAMGMRDPYKHKQSFNRQNLRYCVKKKTGKIISEIATMIKDRHGQTGIIYCLSKKDTENVAEELQKEIPSMKRQITFYHADVRPDQREERQRLWSKGDIKVICATIAFGMGINKPDVRYVIHYSMPKSLTNYYQESGRAGRDSYISDCIVFYSHKDKQTLATMIFKGHEERSGGGRGGRYNHHQNSNGGGGNGNGTLDSVKRDMDNLHACMSYCLNMYDCRRVLLLRYFDEPFPVEACMQTCDNCRMRTTMALQDFTDHALVVLGMMNEITENGYPTPTLITLAKLFSGSKSKDLQKYSGMRSRKDGKDIHKDLIERLLQTMLTKGFLEEEMVETGSGFTAFYVRVGVEAYKLEQRQESLTMAVTNPRGRLSTSSSTGDVSMDVVEDEVGMLDDRGDVIQPQQEPQQQQQQEPLSGAVLSGQSSKKTKPFKIPEKNKEKDKEKGVGKKKSKDKDNANSKSSSVPSLWDNGLSSPSPDSTTASRKTKTTTTTATNSRGKKTGKSLVIDDSDEEEEEDDYLSFMMEAPKSVVSNVRKSRDGGLGLGLGVLDVTTGKNRATTGAAARGNKSRAIDEFDIYDVDGDGDIDTGGVGGTGGGGSTGTGAGKSTGPKLTITERSLLRAWLNEYRKQWESYWNYLNNQTIQELLENLPQTKDELRLIGGIGETKVKNHGDHIMATIWAFLDSNGLLQRFPKIVKPTIPECPTWLRPQSVEAEEIRAERSRVKRPRLAFPTATTLVPDPSKPTATATAAVSDTNESLSFQTQGGLGLGGGGEGSVMSLSSAYSYGNNVNGNGNAAYGYPHTQGQYNASANVPSVNGNLNGNVVGGLRPPTNTNTRNSTSTNKSHGLHSPQQYHHTNSNSSPVNPQYDSQETVNSSYQRAGGGQGPGPGPSTLSADPFGRVNDGSSSGSGSSSFYSRQGHNMSIVNNKSVIAKPPQSPSFSLYTTSYPLGAKPTAYTVHSLYSSNRS